MLLGGRKGGRKGTGRDRKGQERTWEGHGHIPCLDWGDGFTHVYICQNLPNCTFYVLFYFLNLKI